jgi:hypothetical protein
MSASRYRPIRPHMPSTTASVVDESEKDPVNDVSIKRRSTACNECQRRRTKVRNLKNIALFSCLIFAMLKTVHFWNPVLRVHETQLSLYFRREFWQATQELRKKDGGRPEILPRMFGWHFGGNTVFKWWYPRSYFQYSAVWIINERNTGHFERSSFGEWIFSSYTVMNMA